MDLLRIQENAVGDVTSELRAGRCHLVTFAEVGLSVFSAHCEFAYGIMQGGKQEHYANQVNNAKETGTLFPEANITILPNFLFRDNYTSDAMMTCLRDAFLAERDYVKSGRMIIDFTCSEVPMDDMYHLCNDLCENEFGAVEGRVLLLDRALNIMDIAKKGMARRPNRSDLHQILKHFITSDYYELYMGLFFRVLRSNLDDPSILHEVLSSDCIERSWRLFVHKPSVEGKDGAFIYQQLMEILMSVESDKIKTYLRETFPELARRCDEAPCYQKAIQDAERWYAKQLLKDSH